MTSKSNDIVVSNNGHSDNNYSSNKDSNDQQRNNDNNTNNISQDLQNFYKSHHVNLQQELDVSNHTIRYIRLNPKYDTSETLSLLEKETLSKPKPVSWLPNFLAFYSIPSSFRLNQSQCFQDGRIYGMDISSGAAVSALLTTLHDDNDEYNSSNQKKQQEQDNNISTIRILDLCCAPGLKLCAMADYFHYNNQNEQQKQQQQNKAPKNSTNIIIGVDISKHRMDLCQKIIEKYQIQQQHGINNDINNFDTPKIQLYCQDGTIFGLQSPPNLIWDSSIAQNDYQQHGGTRKRKNKSARARQRKQLKTIMSNEWTSLQTNQSAPVLSTAQDGNNDDNSADQNAKPSGHNDTTNEALSKNSTSLIPLFTHVLVDAECSTDGSLKHVMQKQQQQQQQQQQQKQMNATSAVDNTMLLNPKELSELVALQRKLLSNGFQLLQPNGTLVYSTCSLAKEQNEDIVQWLLQKESKTSFLIKLSKFDCTAAILSPYLPGTMRFLPSANMGGFYVAKIGKR